MDVSYGQYLLREAAAGALPRHPRLPTRGKGPYRALAQQGTVTRLTCPEPQTPLPFLTVLPKNQLPFCAAYLQLLEAAPLPVQLHQHLHQALCGQQAAVAAREPRQQQRSAGLFHPHTSIISRGGMAWALGARGCGRCSCHHQPRHPACCGSRCPFVVLCVLMAVSPCVRESCCWESACGWRG